MNLEADGQRQAVRVRDAVTTITGGIGERMQKKDREGAEARVLLIPFREPEKQVRPRGFDYQVGTPQPIKTASP